MPVRKGPPPRKKIPWEMPTRSQIKNTVTANAIVIAVLTGCANSASLCLKSISPIPKRETVRAARYRIKPSLSRP